MRVALLLSIVSMVLVGALGQQPSVGPGPISPSQTPTDKKEQTLEDLFPTPLGRAIVRKQGVLVRYLLFHGANPNGEDGRDYAQIPILVAADVGDLEILRLLLDAGARIEARNEIGITALMFATLRGDLSTVDFLISRQADVNARMDKGVTALMIAGRDQQVGILRSLLKARADVNLSADGGVTALMAAGDDSATVEALLEAGAKIEAVDKQGWTAVCYAYAQEEKHAKKLASLLARGANSNPQCPDRKLPPKS